MDIITVQAELGCRFST